MCTLQLEKDIGGMAHPNLKDYYRAAQLRPAIKWCAEGYTSKWKDIERAVAGIPTQSLIGSAELIHYTTRHDRSKNFAHTEYLV